MENIKATICECVFDVAYIFRNYISATTVNNAQDITFTDTQIESANISINNDCCIYGSLKGYQIGLKWADEIPKEERDLTLTYDKDDLQGVLTKILKKERVTISIIQCRSDENADLFMEEGSSDKFLICVTEGDLDSECLQAISAIRKTEKVNIKDYIKKPYEEKPHSIPGKRFKSMMTTLGKIKNEDTNIILYRTEEKEQGVLFKSTAKGAKQISQKFGIIDEENDEKYKQNIYRINTDRVVSLSKLAFHPEGSVMLFYEEGCDLLFYYEIGCYGTIEYYIPIIKEN